MQSVVAPDIIFAPALTVQYIVRRLVGTSTNNRLWKHFQQQTIKLCNNINILLVVFLKIQSIKCLYLKNRV